MTMNDWAVIAFAFGYPIVCLGAMVSVFISVKHRYKAPLTKEQRKEFMLKDAA